MQWSNALVSCYFCPKCACAQCSCSILFLHYLHILCLVYIVYFVRCDVTCSLYGSNKDNNTKLSHSHYHAASGTRSLALSAETKVSVEGDHWITWQRVMVSKERQSSKTSRLQSLNSQWMEWPIPHRSRVTFTSPHTLPGPALNLSLEACTLSRRHCDLRHSHFLNNF